MTTFIYALLCPITGHIRYIGKSNNPNKRFWEHMSRSNSKTKSKTYCYDWIRSLTSQNLKPNLEILDEVLQSEWEFWEEYYISLYKTWGFKLTNITLGGSNYSEEAKQKAKETRLKNNKPRVYKKREYVAKPGKPIRAINIETGESQEFISLKSMVKELKLNENCVYDVLKGYRRNAPCKSHHGYKFERMNLIH